jgi:hypothetical protein
MCVHGATTNLAAVRVCRSKTVIFTSRRSPFQFGDLDYCFIGRGLGSPVALFANLFISSFSGQLLTRFTRVPTGLFTAPRPSRSSLKGSTRVFLTICLSTSGSKLSRTFKERSTPQRFCDLREWLASCRCLVRDLIYVICYINILRFGRDWGPSACSGQAGAGVHLLRRRKLLVTGCFIV